MSLRPPAPRTVHIRPASRVPETVGVLVFVAVVATLMTWRVSLIERDIDTPSLAAYQRLDTGLDATTQLVFRTLLAAVGDVGDLREIHGQWPEARDLADALVPPFAAELMPVDLARLQWVAYDGGTWVDYLGVGDGVAGDATYLLRVIDLHGGYHPHPHPGVDYDPNRLTAAQVWVYDEPGRHYPGERLPEAGWAWILRPGDPIVRRAVGGESAASSGLGNRVDRWSAS